MMKEIVVVMAVFFSTIALNAQQINSKIFWKEDFSKGVIPEGWKTNVENDSSITWFVTDQPFPGSWGRNYQAPPIASNSRGYHLQYAPGVKTAKFYKTWNKAKKYPNASIQTPFIDCSKKSSVVLKFQQNFFWNDRLLEKGAGLFIGVSNDGINWVEYDVRYAVPAWEDCPNPMNVELNITKTAANQKNVQIRFYWKGIYHWYWMIDDVELSEAYDNDIEAYRLKSHSETNNKFTSNDEIVFQLVNLSSKQINSDFNCILYIDKREPIKVTVTANPKRPIGIIDTVLVKFPNLNLTDFGLHKVKFYSQFPNDQRKSNDTISTIIYSGAYELGKVTGFANKTN